MRAYEDGAHGIECDVFLLPKCGTLVVFHGVGSDQDAGRLTGYCCPESTCYVESGKADDLSIVDLDFTQVQNLKFDKYGRQFACPSERIEHERVPKLEDVLLLCKERGLHITVELKGEGTAEPSLKLVEKMDMVDNVTFSSFKHYRIAKIRELRPDSYRYKTGALFTILPDNFIEIALNVGASEVHLRYDSCSKDNVAKVHSAGMGSMAWFRGYLSMKEDSRIKYLDVGNEDEDMYAIVMSSGVMKMCVNRPDLLVGMVNK